MDIGLVLQTDPPAQAVVDLMVRAEGLGFSHGWTFDSHVLWQEPYVIYPRILERTSRMVVGPMVTNPGTRDWTVIASLHATLDEQFGHRTICGIGRGDSAVRVQGRPPTTLARLEAAIGVIRDLAAGRAVDLGGTQVQIPWVAPGVPELPVWMAGYGPKALDLVGRCADGFILQLADPYLVEWTVKTVRSAAEAAGRDPSVDHDLRGGARLRRRHPTWPTPGTSAVGSGGWWATTSPTWSRATARNRRRCPRSSPSTSRAARATTTATTAGRATLPRTSCRTRSSTGSACWARPRRSSSGSRACGTLGVDQFAIYAMHDAREATIEAYGESVIPHLPA